MLEIDVDVIGPAPLAERRERPVGPAAEEWGDVGLLQHVEQCRAQQVGVSAVGQLEHLQGADMHRLLA